MPLHLVHGRAGPAKSLHLIKTFKGRHLASRSAWDSFRLIVPTAAHVLACQRTLATSLNGGVLFGNPIVTWDDFVLEWVKTQSPRVHAAGHEFCEYVLFLTLAAGGHDRILQGFADGATAAGKIYAVFLALKAAGITPARIVEILNGLHDIPGLGGVFEKFQDTLTRLGFQDPGDQTLRLLNLLRQGHLRLPAGLTQLYFSRIFPFRPGLREVLRALKQRFPDLALHIDYDEDFARPDDILSRAFEDLGVIADTTEFVPAETPRAITVREFASVFHEAHHVAQTIASSFFNAAPENNSAHHIVAVTARDILPPLTAELARLQIPFGLSYPVAVGDCLKHLPATETLPTLRRLSRDDHLPVAGLKLRALATIQQFHEDMRFVETLYPELTAHVPAERRQAYLEARAQALTLPAVPALAPVIITNIAKASIFTDATLHLTGYALEGLLPPATAGTDPFDAVAVGDLAEVIETAGYSFRIRMARLKHLIDGAQHLHVSRSAFDARGRPLSLLAGPDLPHVAVTRHDPEVFLKTTSLAPRDYFKTKRHAFSVTELQEYIDCPYAYYARFHLKLAAEDPESVEPLPKLRGLMVHRVMERLIRANESDYLEGLEYQSYRTKVLRKLATLVADERAQLASLGRYAEEILDTTAFRVYTALRAVIAREAEWYASQKKRTTPKFVEWRFGHDKLAFSLPLTDGAITVTGRIDRVDVSRALRCFSVIDYKTGATPSLETIRQGLALQMPIYLMAVGKLLCKDYQASGAFYYQLKENNVGGFAITDTPDAPVLDLRRHVDKEAWGTIKDAVLKAIARACDGIHAGSFDPAPRDPGKCRTCDYRSVCSYHQAEENELP